MAMEHSKPELLYHYTDINALVNMLEKEYIFLRLSNVLFLNDPNEIAEGLNIVKKYVEEYQKTTKKETEISSVLKTLQSIKYDIFSSFYLISFCQSDNNLNMWRTYADNGKGCALCFDFEILETEFKKFSKNIEEKDEIDIGIDQCLYSEDDIKKEIDTYMRHYIDSNPISKYISDEKSKELSGIINHIANTCVIVKNKYYQDESEWRLVFYNQVPNNLKEVKFRVRNNYVVPFIEFKVSSKSLKEIILGPTSSDLTKQSINNLLKIKGYWKENSGEEQEIITVRKSTIPYRG